MSADNNPAARLELQRAGTHPAPCARHCEAAAFRAMIRGLEAERDALRAELTQCQRALADQAAVSAQRADEVAALRAGLDAALDFAGTVGGGSSWWDDVWKCHESAIDVAGAALAQPANPVRRQPLTDEQIRAIDHATDDIEVDSTGALEFARAIERAHGITTACPQCGAVDGHKLQCGERTDGQIKLSARGEA